MPSWLAPIVEWVAQFLLSKLTAWAAKEIKAIEQRGIDDDNADAYKKAQSRKERADAALNGLNGVCP